MRFVIFVISVLSGLGAVAAHATLYSYTNADGEYVVSQSPPADKNTQYAVLTDDGEFVRMVPGRNQEVPITHWRPWFIPKEPHPFDSVPGAERDRAPVVTVDEDERSD
jgi:hypothetical protein